MDLAERTLELCRIPSPLGQEDEIALRQDAVELGEQVGNAALLQREIDVDLRQVLVGILQLRAELTALWEEFQR